jgi:hypothetical protein
MLDDGFAAAYTATNERDGALRVFAEAVKR